MATYTDIVFQLDSPRRVQLNLLQGLSHDIVGLSLGCLCGFDGGGLVDITLVIDVEFAESIGKAKDVGLLELRVFPIRRC